MDHEEVPQLRIVSDDVWTAAKERQERTRYAVRQTGTLGAAKRPKYLFSGLTKCGVCGAGFIMLSAEPARVLRRARAGTCNNHLTIRRDEVEARVLTALQDKLLRQDLFEEFCDEFTREMNRLRMEHRASLSAAERELERIEARRPEDDRGHQGRVSPAEVKDEMNANARKARGLKAKLDAATSRRRSCTQAWPTCTARRSPPGTGARASRHPHGSLRGASWPHRRHRPDAERSGDSCEIELKGNLAAMLGAAQNAKRSPETGDLCCNCDGCGGGI